MVGEARRRLARRIALGSLATGLILVVPSLLLFLLGGMTRPDFLVFSLLIATPLLVTGFGLAARIRWGKGRYFFGTDLGERD